MPTRKTTLVLAGAALAVCYADVVRSLVTAWMTSEVYSYGLAVVAIGVYLVWTRWDRLRMLPAVPDYFLGVPITLAGLALLAAGHIGLLISLQQASLVVTFAGFVLLFWGRSAFACIWFPLAYVVLGFPLWGTVIGWLQPPSQLLSARLATVLLRGIGIPVLQNGTQLVLANVTVEVLRECSGVNQLLAIIAMTLPASYIWLRTNSRRAVLIALAVVGAYGSNGVRIALVGFLATHGLSNGDLRSVHLAEGLLISALCYLVILGSLWLLSRTERNENPVAVADKLPATAASVRHASLEVGIAAVTLAAGIVLQLFHTPDVRLRGDLHTFPEQIGDWSLEKQPTPGRFPAIDDELIHAYPSPEGERHFTALDDELVRTYRNGSGDRVRLYIGYHRSQREGKELVGDAGHALNNAGTPLLVHVGSRTVELGQVVDAGPSSTRGVLYWYDLNGRVLRSIYLAKRYLVWDALTRGRTNGAVVMVGWESTGSSNPDVVRTKAEAFAQSILSLLPKFIPS